MKFTKESAVPIIEKRKFKRRIARTFRLKPELDDKLGEISIQTGESKTYVLESLLEHAIKAYEKEKSDSFKKRKKK